jgi:hypothetical protein
MEYFTVDVLPNSIFDSMSPVRNRWEGVLELPCTCASCYSSRRRCVLFWRGSGLEIGRVVNLCHVCVVAPQPCSVLAASLLEHPVISTQQLVMIYLRSNRRELISS